MKKIIHLIIMACLFLSCQQNKSYNNQFETKRLELILKRGPLAEKYTKVIVIPGVGCTGCISDAQIAFIKNYKDVKTLYIFTAIADMKLFKNALPTDAFNYGNTFLDTENQLLKIGFNSVYPSKLIIKDTVVEIKPL